MLFVLGLAFACVACAATSRDAGSTGEASWYGAAFAGRPTASGEPYNPKALTAAHQTLPFGTRVRVTNLDNDKSVVVRINDRFPGTKGRIIDLSETAFASIAPTSQGIARVRVQVLD
ncbi:MAG: septal ring lytic transglycosylase RlpA family protein [Candidatus Sumerlaeia bacterium]|nr:septal ring lytic transglycosylase RlpA family protein [Candidatus Sumerlaeia bacterium]